MKKIKLDILGISYSQSQSGAYALIFGEAGKKRRLPIIIGSFEAQAIAIELEKMKPSRPLTHDLFKNFATTFNISITEVIIYKFHEGIFYAKLICFDGVKEVEIDSRTSDAVAIAVRFKCPIYTYEKILAAAGIVMQEGDESLETKEKSESKSASTAEDPGLQYSHMTLKELETKLMEAIDAEAYEKASLIRDEINKRKGTSK
ncbi:MAG: bifunctional nuclease family protein [Bacteroidales bacterium]|nr:bifunctional nuclease family protein [Bacteroidales bacterium]